MLGDGELETAELSPEALELRPYGNIGVAYACNEPLIGYEYVRDCAALVHEQDMVNVRVTNGTIEEGPWRELIEYLSVDCTAAEGERHSDSEIKIAQPGYGIRNGVKTKEF